MKTLLFLFCLLLFPLAVLAQYQQDTVIAEIPQTFGVEMSPAGELHICSVGAHQVVKINAEGEKVVVAGTGQKGYAGDGGPAAKAMLNEPYEIRFDKKGNMYMVEMKNHVIRMVDPKGNIHTLAGTSEIGFAGDGMKGTKARFNRPHSIALDEKKNWLYIADIGNHRIRRLHLKTRNVETFAGTGAKHLPVDGKQVTGRAMLGPRALFVEGRTLWVALREGHSVWKINLDTRVITHVSGTGKKGYSGDGGPARKATFNGPKGIVAHPKFGVFVVDTENQAIRRINLRSETITSIASNATNAGLGRPHGICLGQGNRVLVGDTNNHRVIRLQRTK